MVLRAHECSGTVLGAPVDDKPLVCQHVGLAVQRRVSRTGKELGEADIPGPAVFKAGLRRGCGEVLGAHMWARAVPTTVLVKAAPLTTEPCHRVSENSDVKVPRQMGRAE